MSDLIPDDPIAEKAHSEISSGLVAKLLEAQACVPSLQSQKLQQLKDSSVQSSIYLQNGIRIIGRILAFDDTGITIEPPDGAGLEELVVTRSLVSSVAKSRSGDETRRTRSPNNGGVASASHGHGRDRDRDRDRDRT